MIRRWTPEDAEASYALYADAVLNGPGRHYTQAQRAAWVPSRIMEPWWPERLNKAEAAWVSIAGKRMTGLIALTGEGWLDLFFVAPAARGDGTARALYDRLAQEARARQIAPLATHASDDLRPFLERRGWRVAHQDLVARGGVTLRRWAMSLDQSAGSQAS